MAVDDARPGDFDDAERPYDLCIIGAGIAGLNALFVATQYLPKTARVALIDRHAHGGGMWNTAYPYVRLHQPHPMFTVGNLKWQWDKPKDYLATRDEVIAHFQYCLAQLRQRVTLTEFYGHTAFDIVESQGEDGYDVRLKVSPLDRPSESIQLISKKLIEAVGFEVPVPSALKLSSEQVNSITPQELGADESQGPVYVIGGGKTGMDTVLEVLRRSPLRQVSLIHGRGAIFGKREVFAPSGLKRWRHGTLLSRCFSDLAMRYDGTNAEETFEYFRREYSIAPTPDGDHNLFGIMSEQESADISQGLSDSFAEYLVDVCDADDGPQMVFRSGSTLPIPVGSTVVNCTGHLFRESKPTQPYVSARGNTLRVNTRSAVHFLSTVSAYFLTHLFYLGRLPSADLYALDSEALFHKNRKDWQLASVALSFMNAVILIDTLPFKALGQCGLDLDRWFPLHRRVGALLDVKMKQSPIPRALQGVSQHHPGAPPGCLRPPFSVNSKPSRQNRCCWAALGRDVGRFVAK